MDRRVLLGVALFFAAVVLLEGNGYLIHHDLYEHGLGYSEVWAWKDNLIKIALYQYVIFTVFLIHKSWSVWVLTEVFWGTSTQDLVFYLVWNRGIFPAADWRWLPFFSIFGRWTVIDQLTLSMISMVSVGFLLWVAKRWELYCMLRISSAQCAEKRL